VGLAKVLGLDWTVGVVTDSGMGTSGCPFGVAPVVIFIGRRKIATRLNPRNERRIQVCFTDICIPKEFDFPKIVGDLDRFCLDLATIKVYLKNAAWVAEAN
jgi:hypothetical protein